MFQRKIRGLVAVSFVGAALVAGGCKKAEEPAQTAEAAAAAAGAAAGADAAAAVVGTENLNKAKALIDRMAGDLEKMTTEVEAAGSDQTKIKAIGDKFKAQAEGMKSEGEALRKLLTDAENKELEGYAKEKIAPLTGRLLAAMMKAQVAAQGAPEAPTPTEGAAAAPGAAPAPGGAAPAPTGDAPAAAPAAVPAK